MRVALLALLLMQCTTQTPPPAETTPAPRPPMTESASSSGSFTGTITGTVTKEGVECPAVRGDDGKLYTIATADRSKLTAGARVRITGTLAQMSTCMQGVTINATKIEVVQ
jgi:hypothetical protein